MIHKLPPKLLPEYVAFVDSNPVVPGGKTHLEMFLRSMNDGQLTLSEVRSIE